MSSSPFSYYYKRLLITVPENQLRWIEVLLAAFLRLIMSINPLNEIIITIPLPNEYFFSSKKYCNTTVKFFGEEKVFILFWNRNIYGSAYWKSYCTLTCHKVLPYVINICLRPKPQLQSISLMGTSSFTFLLIILLWYSSYVI